ncbi:MAG: hypothetical protein ACMZ64_02175 [Oleiphilus sp.]
MQATHRDAEERYTIIRKAVLDELNKEFYSSNQLNLKAKLIDSIALAQSERWNLSSRRKVDWEWFEGYKAFKYRHPKRFEMALFHNNTLASLSLGRPSYQGTKLRLDFIEGNPDKPSNVKVFEPTFLAMVGYAHALGAKELRIMNPINGDVRRYYERFGFAYTNKDDYLYVKL